MHLQLPSYPPTIAGLWPVERLPELGPGVPNHVAAQTLKRLTIADFPNLKDEAAARACLAGLWLFHDFLDESHTISQELPAWYGSYWHAIMHRREPDAWNSQYWFRRVPDNPVYVALRRVEAYDPPAFVDRCERVRGTNTDDEKNCREWQRLEMQTLFAWCYQQAVGTT